VRNYQARNMLRDDMQKAISAFSLNLGDDRASRASSRGARVIRGAALDRKASYYDPESDPKQPLVQRRHPPRRRIDPPITLETLQTCASEPQGHGDTAKRQPARDASGDREWKFILTLA
jgi:predicted RNA-binding protein with PUA-like domain